MKKWLTILAAVLVVVMLIGVYKAKADAAKTRADVNALEERIEDKQADIRALRAEIAARESPANVEELAREHLGLAPGAAPQALPEHDLARRLPAPETHP